MPRFVEGNGALFFLGNDFCPLLQAANDAVNSVQKVLVNDLVAALACSIQSSFIAHIRNVGSAESGSLARKEIHIDAVVHLDGTQVHVENRFAFGQVRHVHVNLAIKTPGTHQGLVQYICAVGCGEDDHPAVGTEPVHLSEELVKGVLAFVV